MRLTELVDRFEGALVPVGALPADPPVLSVVTTDLLDPRRYLSGGELVLTGLAWWRPDQPERSRDFVAALVNAGVAGLAAGEAEYGEVPLDLVAECARAGMPLLRVPLEFSFADITERAMRQLASGEGLVELLNRHRSLVAAVAAREQGHAGLDGVLGMIEQDVGLRCWVLTPAGRMVAGATPRLDESERRRLVRRHLERGRLDRRSGEPAAVTLGGRRVSLVAAPPQLPAGVAWLLAVEGAAEPAVVEVLASLVALEREMFLRRPEREVELAAALGGTSSAEMMAALTRCGLDPLAPAVVVAARGEYAGPVLTDLLADQPGRWAVGEGPGGWAWGVVATDDAAALVQRLSTAVGALDPGLGPAPLRVGVSDPVTGGQGLLGAAAEARAVAVAVTESLPHTVTGPDRLSSHSLLLAGVPAELRQAYRARVLGPLIGHDRAHRTELVQTLAVYLDCSGSWSRCAERMHLHVNTVRYRVERIEALTGRDLRRLEDQVDLLLALRLPGDGS